MTDDTHIYRRVKASNLLSSQNLSVCLIGRISKDLDNKSLLDCGDIKVYVRDFNPDAYGLRTNEFVEIRGEVISDNMIRGHGHTKISQDFNLTAYNKVVELLEGCYDEYK